MGEAVLKDVNKYFDELKAIIDFNMKIEDGEFVSLIGPSGCGKTTVLRMVAGLIPATSGKILINGNKVENAGRDRGMVFQEHCLFPWRNVRSNIEFGLEIKGLSRDERHRISSYYIEMVGLEGFEKARPGELSGGMKQRTGIARALANDPEVLLMDEPFGSLDSQTRNIMQEELLDIWKKTKKTVLFITHSVDEAVYLSDRIVVMTALPGTVKKNVEINLERKRDRAGKHFAEKRHEVLSILQEEVMKAFEKEKER